jgi:cysteine synthase
MHSSIIDAIGNTPLVELKNLSRQSGGRILAKLENLNPGGSKKDRVARQIIEDAENQSLLTPGQTVVELTSGNTGTGLAIVCRAKNYPFVAVMSEGNTSERAQMMRALGAEVFLVPQAPGSVNGKVSGEDLALVEDAAQRLVRDKGAFRADQFNNESNFRAHYLHTGQEILKDSPDQIDLFCDFVGTGGTFAGCAAAFKETSAATKCYVVEPAGAAALAGADVTASRHRIQGGGYSHAHLKLLRPEHIDGFVEVTDIDAIAAARELARVDGVFAGYSTGANLAATLKLMQDDFRDATAVIVVADSGLKYVSTDLWVV